MFSTNISLICRRETERWKINSYICSFVKLHRTSDILLQKFYAFLMSIVFSEPQQPNCGLDRLIM